MWILKRQGYLENIEIAEDNNIIPEITILKKYSPNIPQQTKTKTKINIILIWVKVKRGQHWNKFIQLNKLNKMWKAKELKILVEREFIILWIINLISFPVS